MSSFKSLLSFIATEQAYRYDVVTHGSWSTDMTGEMVPSGLTTVQLYCHSFPVTRHTPKGYWIDAYAGSRFVRTELSELLFHLLRKKLKK